MHGVHLLDLDALNKWLASVEMRTSPDVNMHDFLPDKDAMLQLYAGFYQGMTSRVYVLVLSAFHRRVSFISPGVELARFSGNSWDPDAPLWVRRLPMHKHLHFPQPLAFVAKLFAGMTDIPRGLVFVKNLSFNFGYATASPSLLLRPSNVWIVVWVAAPKALKHLDRRLAAAASARSSFVRVIFFFPALSPAIRESCRSPIPPLRIPLPRPATLLPASAEPPKCPARS
ncbi:hypothetical protein B0H14DRAFT_3520986 [Mycena olivaceomarginata]|nr:hypothetical protein B0H14DRAFT_3520986 [Mycena olivaceomarginata]